MWTTTRRGRPGRWRAPPTGRPTTWTPPTASASRCGLRLRCGQGRQTGQQRCLRAADAAATAPLQRTPQLLPFTLTPLRLLKIIHIPPHCTWPTPPCPHDPPLPSQGTDDGAMDYGLNRALDAYYNDRKWFHGLQKRVMEQVRRRRQGLFSWGVERQADGRTVIGASCISWTAACCASWSQGRQAPGGTPRPLRDAAALPRSPALLAGLVLEQARPRLHPAVLFGDGVNGAAPARTPQSCCNQPDFDVPASLFCARAPRAAAPILVVRTFVSICVLSLLCAIPLVPRIACRVRAGRLYCTAGLSSAAPAAVDENISFSHHRVNNCLPLGGRCALLAANREFLPQMGTRSCCFYRCRAAADVSDFTEGKQELATFQVAASCALPMRSAPAAAKQMSRAAAAKRRCWRAARWWC